MEIAARTDKGKVRKHNEDRYYTHAPSGLIVVADGMGGHNAGEVASRMAVDVFRAWIESPDARPQLSLRSDEPEAFSVLRHLLGQANRQIYDAARHNRAHTGMGTTLIAGWVQKNTLYFAHVGDSRLYRFRAGRLRQLTVDHSLVQELVSAGTLTLHAAQSDPRRYVVRRSVGIAPVVEVDLGQASLQSGDILLACTDGLHDMVEHDTITALLADNAEEPQAACDALVEQALDNGGSDNLTVVLVQIGAASSAVPTVRPADPEPT
jgi:protein phosphatase